MAYSICVKLKPKSKKLRSYLRENGFQIYSQSYVGDFVVNRDDDVDEPNKWLCYKCLRTGHLAPLQAVIQRIDEEHTHGVVLSYHIDIQ